MNFNTLPAPWDLRYFQEIAATGSLSRAAERLGVGQPALSLSLKRLEDQLRTQLFLRRSRKLDLTEAGRVLLREVNRLLENWSRVESEISKSQTELIGRFQLGIHVSVANYSLREVIRKIYESYPSIEIRLIHNLSRIICEEVIAGQIDFGYVVNPVAHPDLVIHKVAKDEVSYFFTAGALQDVLICNPELVQTQNLLKKNKHHKFNRVIESSSLEVIATLTESGAGVGILPTRVAKTSHQPLRKLPDAPVFVDDIAFVHRVDAPKSQANMAVIKAFKSIQI